MMTVVLCVNRTTPFLREAVTSILSQELETFELLIGANACPDSLTDELQALVGADPRVRIIRSGVPQLTYNLNLLIDAAAHPWIVRMDADDVSEPNRLQMIADEIERTDADVIGSWATIIDGQGNVVGRFQPEACHDRIRRGFRFRTQLCHPTVAFRKAFWIDMRGYLGGFVSEDYDLWLRALNAGKRFANIPTPLLRYRVHSSQASRTRRGYAEVASHWYRELLCRPTWFNLVGWFVATGKLVWYRGT